MPENAPAIRTHEDMVRAFHFPRPRLRDAAFLLAGALLLALLLKLLSMRKARAAAPAVGSVDASQRRSEFRVPAQLPAEYRPDGSPDWLIGTVCDLSAGGVTLMVESLHAPTGRLDLRFRHAEEGLRAEVVRSDVAQWSRRHYLHCRFLDLAPDLEHRLRKAIADRERELLRRAKP